MAERPPRRAIAAWIALATAAALAEAPPPDGWSTCGSLASQYNRTACPAATGTCCTGAWSPADEKWGCCPLPNAVCCNNTYTCCPAKSKCVDSPHPFAAWAVVTTCVPEKPASAALAAAAIIGPQHPAVVEPLTEPADPDAGLGYAMCKTGGGIPFSSSKKNIIVMGDSVSIGYAPKVQLALGDGYLVQQ